MSERMQYRTRLRAPDFTEHYPWDTAGARRSFYETIEGIGWVKPVGYGSVGTRPDDGEEFFIYLEAWDLYELAMRVKELEDELNSAFQGWTIDLDRPKPVVKKDRI